MLGAAGTLGARDRLVADFDSGAAGLQHTVDDSWIPGLGVRYSLGVDGINLFLVLLTAVLWLGGDDLRRLQRARAAEDSSS